MSTPAELVTRLEKADLEPPGLGQHATLLVDRLHDPLPGVATVDFDRWARAVRATLADLLSRADRWGGGLGSAWPGTGLARSRGAAPLGRASAPARHPSAPGSLPLGGGRGPAGGGLDREQPSAPAVLLEDEVSLLAATIEAISRAEGARAWYQRALAATASGQSPAALLAAQPELAAATLVALRRGRGGSSQSGLGWLADLLSEDDCRGLVLVLADAHGLTSLLASPSFLPGGSGHGGGPPAPRRRDLTPGAASEGSTDPSLATRPQLHLLVLLAEILVERPGWLTTATGGEQLAAFVRGAARLVADAPRRPVPRALAGESALGPTETSTEPRASEEPLDEPSPGPTPGVLAGSGGAAVATSFGGFVYVCNLCRALGLFGRWEADPGWSLVAALTRAVARPSEPQAQDHFDTDPLWDVLVDLSGGSDDLATIDARCQELSIDVAHSWGGWVPDLRAGSTVALPALIVSALSALSASASPPALLGVPGQVVAGRTHVDVNLPLSAVDLDVRRAGLDASPGWVPELGRVVTLEFVG